MLAKYIAMLKYNEKVHGTAFFITKSLAVTALHTLNNRSNNEQISLLLDSFEKPILVQDCIPIYDLDLAIFKTNICDFNNFPALCNDVIEKGSRYESCGYIGYQNEKIEIDGLISKILDPSDANEFELSINNQREIANWNKFSGSPISIDNSYVGIILKAKSNQNVLPILKGISFNKILSFFFKNDLEYIELFPLTSEISFLRERLSRQKKLFESLFVSEDINISSSNINSVCHFLKPNYDYESDLKNLRNQLDFQLIGYANDLETLCAQHSYEKIIENHNRVKNRVFTVTENIKQQGQFGNLVLWMIIEGYFNIPRVATKVCPKTSLENDIHISYDSSNATKISISYTGIEADLVKSLSKLLATIEKSHSSDLTSNLIQWDAMAIDCLDYSLQYHIRDFIIDKTNLKNIKIDIIALIVHNSLIYTSDILTFNDEKKELFILTNHYKQELAKYQLEIQSMMDNYDFIKQIDINWCLLPLHSINELIIP